MGDGTEDYTKRSDEEYEKHRQQQGGDEPTPTDDGDRGEKRAPQQQRSQAPARRPQSATDVGRRQDSPVVELLRSKGPKMRHVLPKWMPYERFYMLCLRALESYHLQEANPRQVVEAAYEAACLGLEPNTILHQCALIPYGGRHPTVLCQVEYRGYVFLAAQSGVTVQAEAICENDEFSYRDGSDPYLHHVKPLRGGRGEPYAAYAIFELPDGRRIWRVCDETRIQTAMKASKAYQWAESGNPAKGGGKKDSPWHMHPEAMMAKTAVQDASRFIPHAPMMQRAAMVDQARDAGDTSAKHEPLNVQDQQGGDDGDDA